MVTSFEFCPHVVGMIIDSDLDESATERLNQKISEKLGEYQKINLFVELKKDKTISFAGMMKSLIFKLKNASHFSKIAFVGEVSWFKNLMEINDLLLDTEIKTFSNEERLQAITWISE